MLMLLMLMLLLQGNGYGVVILFYFTNGCHTERSKRAIVLVKEKIRAKFSLIHWPKISDI